MSLPTLLRRPAAMASTASTDDIRTARPRRRIIALVVAAGLLAPLFAVAAPAGAKPIGHKRTSTEQHIQMAVLHEINAERHAHGLPAVHQNKKLRNAARHHNLAMSRANYMSHQTGGERSFSARFDHAGYHWIWAGENIGWNHQMTTGGVVTLEKMMYHEQAPNDGHRRNILDKHYRDVGVDVFMDRKHHKVWLTTDYGRK